MHVKPSLGLTLALLLCADLAAAPAHAQLLTLESGDSVTVGSTGTNGTYLGAPLSNATSSYVAAVNYTPVITTAANSTFILNSGGSIMNNGSYADGLDATNSVININGGSITTAFDAASISASGGTVNITGGTLTGTGPATGLATNSATVNISGGTFSGLWGFYASYGTARITGGTFSGYRPSGGAGVALGSASFATISGGSFSSGGFSVGTGSVIDLLGTFSQTAPITGGTGTINGTLLDGETLNAAYNVSAASGGNSSGLIEFNSVPAAPEASSFVSLGLLLLLGLGGVAVSRKRKAGAAR